MGATGYNRLMGVAGIALRRVRSELRVAFVVFVAGFLTTFYALRYWIWPALERRLLESKAIIVAVTPFDVVLLQGKLGLIVGGLLAALFVVYRTRHSERGESVPLPGTRRTRILVGALAVVLFLGGVAYAYLVFLPLLFDFLVNNAIQAGFQPTYSIVDWTQFVLLLTVVLGLTAELPLIMGGLVYADIVSYDLLRNRWRYAVFGIVVLSSMVNGSPDPFSMSLVAIPMTTLYFVGLGCARLVTKRTGNRSGDFGRPVELDLAGLDAAGIRAAPAEAFESLTEHEALKLADDALDEGDHERAAAILDRFDGKDAGSVESSDDESAGDGESAGDEVSTQGTSGEKDGLTTAVEGTASRMASVFTEDGTTEEDIGGYYYDIRFILGSLRSKSFHVAAVFMAVVGLTFTFLYGGGIGAIKRDFLTRLPAGVNPDALRIVLLHPVEALAFEMKVSFIAGALAVLPMVLYYAWPAVESRFETRADRDVFLLWGAALAVGFLGGSLVGYGYVAPVVISYLVADAHAADMIIAYRTGAFFWLVFALTAGVGLLAEIPVTMLLFHHGNVVPYRTMRRRWREVTIAVLVLTAMLPGGLLLMLFIGLALMVAYGVGLIVLWLNSLGNRLMRVVTT
ncbi:twin-arginine translocase subunit TatC [Haladaptatus sp. AB643]|uniref:twin-arginine translocase subunit TatC n=1 Tax=Haladaptatus sp. AB643 TaxID=2934174 RepID=UPI00209BF363|nr:twin-arginine translocase subunit TatC [Haladaptatus sp. AB643]